MLQTCRMPKVQSSIQRFGILFEKGCGHRPSQRKSSQSTKESKSIFYRSVHLLVRAFRHIAVNAIVHCASLMEPTQPRARLKHKANPNNSWHHLLVGVVPRGGKCFAFLGYMRCGHGPYRAGIRTWMRLISWECYLQRGMPYVLSMPKSFQNRPDTN